MKNKGLWFSIVVLVILAGFYFYEVKKERSIQKEKDEQKAIFKTNVDSIVSLEIKKADDTEIKITKDGQWKIVSPVETKVDSVELDKYLSTIQKLKYVSLIANSSSDLSQFGLDNPTFYLTVITSTKKETLLIGSETPVGFQYYAMKAGEKEVFTLNDHDVKDLKKDLFILRYKRLVEMMPEEVEEIIIKTKASQWSLKKKNGTWEGIEDIDNLKVDALLGRLIWTQATGVLTERKDELRGFENPDWSFLLRTKQKAILITFYKATGNSEENLYATSEEISHMFIMPKWLIGHLPNDPSGLRKPATQ